MIYGTDDDDNDATEDNRIKRELIELKTNRNVVNVFLFYVWFFCYFERIRALVPISASQFAILFLALSAVCQISHVA